MENQTEAMESKVVKSDCDFKIRPYDLENLIEYCGGGFLFMSEGIIMPLEWEDGYSYSDNEGWHWVSDRVDDMTLYLDADKEGYISICAEGGIDIDTWYAGNRPEEGAKISFIVRMAHDLSHKRMESIASIFRVNGAIRFKATLTGMSILLRLADNTPVIMNRQYAGLLSKSQIVDDTLTCYLNDKECKIEIDTVDGMANIYIIDSSQIICDTGTKIISLSMWKM